MGEANRSPVAPREYVCDSLIDHFYPRRKSACILLDFRSFVVGNGIDRCVRERMLDVANQCLDATLANLHHVIEIAFAAELQSELTKLAYRILYRFNLHIGTVSLSILLRVEVPRTPRS